MQREEAISRSYNIELYDTWGVTSQIFSCFYQLTVMGCKSEPMSSIAKYTDLLTYMQVVGYMAVRGICK